MNSNRLYIGNVYVNMGIGQDGKYEIKLSEKDVLLIKVGNKFIRASFINNKYDLISLFTILKYFPLNYDTPLSDYMYSTKKGKKGTVFVDKNSLKSLFDEKIKLNFIDIKLISLYYNYLNNREKDNLEIEKVLRKKYKNK